MTAGLRAAPFYLYHSISCRCKRPARMVQPFVPYRRAAPFYLYPADVSAQYPLKKHVHNSEKSLVGLNERKTKGCNILDEPLPVSEKSPYMFLKRFVEFQKSTRGLHHTPSCRRERPLPSEKNPDMCLKGARTYFWKGSWNWKRARQRNVPHRILQTSAPNKL